MQKKSAPGTLRVANGKATLTFKLPRQAVSQVELTW
jgi:hypothetical protein